MVLSRLFAALVAAVVVFAGHASRAETYLLMVEEAGCMWCEAWEAEIGPIYPKTAEARIAPLRRHDLSDGQPQVALATPVNFTPTFVLVQDGREAGRIEGYPGEDFFWGLLTMLLERANLETTAADAGS